MNFKTNSIEDLELLYTALRTEYPNNQIDIIYNYNTKEYCATVTDKPYIFDPEVPVDCSIEVVYGDSVIGNTPLLLRDPCTKLVSIQCIENLCTEFYSYPEFKFGDNTIRTDKQYSTTNLEVWSDNGWNPITKVIRHKTSKRLFCIATEKGIVNVTEDHSLVNTQLEKLKPTEAHVGDNILHSFPSDFYEKQICTKEKIIECIDMYYKGLALPSILLNCNIDRLNLFFQGIQKMPFHNEVSSSNPKLAQQLYFILKKLGYSVHIRTRQNSFVFDYKNKLELSQSIISMCQHNNTDEFVYDLETDCGRFHAGIGEMIVSNTDSIFMRLKFNRNNPESNRIDTFRLASLCGDKITDEVFDRPPIVLEFEKVFQPFILLTKKRYIANKYENMKDPFQVKGVDAKGIALTRRDYCKLVKKCYKEIIDTIMVHQNERGLHDSIVIFKDYVNMIHNYNVCVDDLVVSAQLAKDYKTRPVHVVLAEKLRDRKEEVQVGDRIPYIYIESDNPKAIKSTLGEDPDYAIKHNLKFNRSCYLEQLAKPILGFYRVCLKDYPEMLDDLITLVNTNLERYGSKKLKPSDYKLDD